MRKIVFVGINPPMNSGTTEPFKNCESGRVLEKWIQYLNLHPEQYELANLWNEPTPNNRSLKSKEANAGARALIKKHGDKIYVLVGQQPTIYVGHKVKFKVSLPHPSPRNRVLNAYPDRIPRDLLDNVRAYIEKVWTSDI